VVGTMTGNEMRRTLPNLPVPAGATADDWPSLSHDGVLIRSLTWSTHDMAKCSVQ
jgi:hypothetical protein